MNEGLVTVMDEANRNECLLLRVYLILRAGKKSPLLSLEMLSLEASFQYLTHCCEYS